MRSMIVLFFVVTLANDHGRERNVKGRHQLQLHAALAFLGFLKDRIVEYKPYEVVLKHTETAEYCRSVGDDIAQLKDRDDILYDLRCML